MDLPQYLLIPLLGLAWLILLGAPPAGYLLARRLRHKPDAAMAVLIFTALVPALILSGVSTASQTLNLALCFAAYAGYCLLAPLTLAIARPALRIAAVILACLPIAAAYTLATIGALALLFLMAQSYPLSRQTMRPGLVCEIHPWGLAGATAAGYAVNLYRTPAALPWVRLLAYSVSVKLVPAAPGPWPGCNQVLQQYDHQRSGFAAPAPAAKLAP